MAMTNEELKKQIEQRFDESIRELERARKAFVRRTPVGAAVAGARETYSQAGKELTEASRQPSFAGRTGSTLGALARIPGRFLGTTAADMYNTAEQVVDTGADSLGRFSRALMTGSEAKSSPPVQSARRESQRTIERPVPAEAGAVSSPAPAIPTRNVITDSQGNRTFIDPETGNIRTISASGQDITGQQRSRQIEPRSSTAKNIVLSPQSAGIKRQWVNTAPVSPDYSSPPAPPAPPPRLADTVNPNVTFGEFVTTGRRQLRAATADQQADLRREDIAQRASSEEMDRLLRTADMALRGQSDMADQNLRREQLEQTGAYQQGKLGLLKKELAAKTAKAGAERSAEAVRQERLNAALNIFDNPNAPPEVKQRARRIIEANQGKASFDLGEKSMTQEAAQKSLQDTWRAVAGSDMPLDPLSIEQLQGVAQANPAAWRKVHGKATPAMVQKYNVLSRLPDEEIGKDPVIASIIKASGGGKTPEEARVILENLIKAQRGF